VENHALERKVSVRSAITDPKITLVKITEKYF